MNNGKNKNRKRDVNSKPFNFTKLIIIANSGKAKQREKNIIIHGILMCLATKKFAMYQMNNKQNHDYFFFTINFLNKKYINGI